MAILCSFEVQDFQDAMGLVKTLFFVVVLSGSECRKQCKTLAVQRRGEDVYKGGRRENTQEGTNT